MTLILGIFFTLYLYSGSYLYCYRYSIKVVKILLILKSIHVVKTFSSDFFQICLAYYAHF